MSLLLRTSSSPLGAAAAAATAVAASSWYTLCQQEQSAASLVEGAGNEDSSSYRMEVHLMDKIQQKTYTQDAKEGIPSTLRILAIDLPEMRTEAFAGECRLSHDKVFVDDIAPPKNIPVPGSDTNDTTKSKHEKMQIAQKALVKSLVHCRSEKSQQKVGVELLEASVADLNRFRLRKTHTFGKFKYDPGKYYESNKTKDSSERQGEEQQPKSSNGESKSGAEDMVKNDNEEVVLPDNKKSIEDEMEAPWNQYAWAEELRLRINGQVPFGAPMERASRIQHYFFGHAYRESVPVVSRFWDMFLPKFAQSDPDGVDGRSRTNCRAASKPHAVIANGAALQRVPSSLRHLQKLCRKADVPLFVIHDPRVWGGNTHQSLQEALKEMRGTIKSRVISKALQEKGSSAFNRGRILGQVETEAKWQVKEKARKTKEMFTPGASERRKADGDWSKLDSTTLERKLVARGVIQRNVEEDTKTYSVGLVELARRCVEEEKKRVSAMEEAAINVSAEEAAPSTTMQV